MMLDYPDVSMASHSLTTDEIHLLKTAPSGSKRLQSTVTLHLTRHGA